MSERSELFLQKNPTATPQARPQTSRPGAQAKLRQVSNGPRRGRADHPGILGENPTSKPWRRWRPGLAAFLHFLFRDLQDDGVVDRINGNGVAVLHQRNRPANRCLRGDVADYKAMAAA